MHYLSIVAIVKNESAFIAEWICWHLIQGVQHFFIFDDSSTDNTREILKKFECVTTILPKPKRPGQLAAYQHFMDYYRKETEWAAFIDADEFLFSTKGDLKDTIKEFPEASIIAVHWLFFGSNGHEKKHDSLVIKRFTKRAAAANQHVKSICKMSDITAVGKNPHIFKTRGVIVNEKHHVLPRSYTFGSNPSADVLGIAHFHTKSREEYFERKKLPRADNFAFTKDVAQAFRAHDVNDVEDFRLFRQADAVRHLMEKMGC